MMANIGNIRLLAGSLFILGILLYIISVNQGTLLNSEEDVLDIEGIVLDKQAVMLSESSVDRFGISDKNVWYNYLVVKESDGEIKNVLISKMMNMMVLQKYAESDDTFYDKGEQVNLKIVKYDDFLFIKENLFLVSKK